MSEYRMHRTKSGLFVPDTAPAKTEPEKPKSKPSSLNRKLRRKLGKPWQGRKMQRDLARREAAAKPIPTVKRRRPRRHNGH